MVQTPQQIAKEKADLRAKLRAEYWKQTTNPHLHAVGEGGHIFDPAVQRYISTRSVQISYFKPTFTSLKWFLGIVVFPIVGYYFILKDERDTKEHRFRTGQVSYRDRLFKFI